MLSSVFSVSLWFNKALVFREIAETVPATYNPRCQYSAQFMETQMDVNLIRADFEPLFRERNGRPPIYFDNGCMTLRPTSVVKAMCDYYTQYPACGGAGRSHHWFAKETNQRVEAARESIRRFLNAAGTDEILFTRNTTEGLNLIARAFPFGKGDVVLTTDKEHNSNLVPWQYMAAKVGISHRALPVRTDNTFDLNALEGALKDPRVKLAAFGHVSNLDGVEIPAAEIIRMCHARGVQVLLDGAQSVPHQRVDVQALGVDYLAFSLHKMCGPSGMGGLYVRRERYADMDKFLVGGDTIRDTWADRAPEFLPPPYRYEAGLQDYAGMIGAGAAVEYLESLDMDAIHRHEVELNRCLSEGLSRYEEIEIIGPADPAKRGSIVCFFTKKPGLGLLADMLDERANIMLRSGMFCVNSWFNARRISRNVTAVRVSLYCYNTLDECKVFLDTVGEILSDPMFEGLPVLPVRE